MTVEQALTLGGNFGFDASLSLYCLCLVLLFVTGATLGMRRRADGEQGNQHNRPSGAACAAS